MDRNKYFDFTRLSNFVQRQAVLNINAMLVAIGAIFGVLLVISLAITLSIAHLNADLDLQENLVSNYIVVFFLAGFVFTSRIFAELHSPQRSYAYLTLPVSTTEKVIGSWILSSPGYVLGYWIIVGIIFLISNLVAGLPISINMLFSRGILYIIGVYIVLQTIFFLGAVYFRKNNFLKTLLSVFALVLIIGLYAGLLAWLFFGGSINGHAFPDDFKAEFWVDIADIFITFILGPFMLIVTYFRLKERQV